MKLKISSYTQTGKTKVKYLLHVSYLDGYRATTTPLGPGFYFSIMNG